MELMIGIAIGLAAGAAGAIYAATRSAERQIAEAHAERDAVAANLASSARLIRIEPAGRVVKLSFLRWDHVRTIEVFPSWSEDFYALQHELLGD